MLISQLRSHVALIIKVQCKTSCVPSVLILNTEPNYSRKNLSTTKWRAVRHNERNFTIVICTGNQGHFPCNDDYVLLVLAHVTDLPPKFITSTTPCGKLGMLLLVKGRASA